MMELPLLLTEVGKEMKLSFRGLSGQIIQFLATRTCTDEQTRQQ